MVRYGPISELSDLILSPASNITVGHERTGMMKASRDSLHAREEVACWRKSDCAIAVLAAEGAPAAYTSRTRERARVVKVRHNGLNIDERIARRRCKPSHVGAVSQ